MVKKPKQAPLVAITWLDHTADSGWVDSSEIAMGKPVEIRSVGWLVHTSRTHYTLASAHDMEAIKAGEGFGSTQLILRKCVTGIYDAPDIEWVKRGKRK